MGPLIKGHIIHRFSIFTIPQWAHLKECQPHANWSNLGIHVTYEFSVLEIFSQLLHT